MKVIPKEENMSFPLSLQAMCAFGENNKFLKDKNKTWM